MWIGGIGEGDDLEVWGGVGWGLSLCVGMGWFGDDGESEIRV